LELVRKKKLELVSQKQKRVGTWGKWLYWWIYHWSDCPFT